MNAKFLALAAAAVILTATAMTGACVEKVNPCDEIDSFAEIYVAGCPEIEAWSTQCASNLGLMEPEVRQDFDWCVECYRAFADSLDLDCVTAPLGAPCSGLLNTTFTGDATTCTWPRPAL